MWEGLVQPLLKLLISILKLNVADVKKDIKDTPMQMEQLNPMMIVAQNLNA